jgi:hypothetical protein
MTGQLRQTFSGTHTRVVTPLMRLQDPDYTRVIIVTLPETTPVLEAQALQEDLRRANIEPFAWVVNASLAAAKPRDALLVPASQRRAARDPQGARYPGAPVRRGAVPGRGAGRRGAAAPAGRDDMRRFGVQLVVV